MHVFVAIQGCFSFLGLIGIVLCHVFLLKDPL